MALVIVELSERGGDEIVNTERGDRSEPTLRPATMLPRTASVGRVQAYYDRSRPPDTAQLRDLRSTVAITGAPGAGRSALVQDIAGLLELKLIDAADFATEGEQVWLERLVEQVLTHEGVLGIENVEHLPAAQQLVLGRILTGTAARARLVPNDRYCTRVSCHHTRSVRRSPSVRS